MAKQDTLGVFITPYVVPIPGVTNSMTWTASGLPDGLSIDANTGQITGKPTRLGDFKVTVTASGGGSSHTVHFSWGIDAQVPGAAVLAAPTDLGGKMLNFTNNYNAAIVALDDTHVLLFTTSFAATYYYDALVVDCGGDEPVFVASARYTYSNPDSNITEVDVGLPSAQDGFALIPVTCQTHLTYTSQPTDLYQDHHSYYVSVVPISYTPSTGLHLGEPVQLVSTPMDTDYTVPTSIDMSNDGTTYDFMVAWSAMHWDTHARYKYSWWKVSLTAGPAIGARVELGNAVPPTSDLEGFVDCARVGDGYVVTTSDCYFFLDGSGVQTDGLLTRPTEIADAYGGGEFPWIASNRTDKTALWDRTGRAFIGTDQTVTTVTSGGGRIPRELYNGAWIDQGYPRTALRILREGADVSGSPISLPEDTGEPSYGFDRTVLVGSKVLVVVNNTVAPYTSMIYLIQMKGLTLTLVNNLKSRAPSPQQPIYTRH